MGWIAYTRTGEMLQEEIHGRPVKDGEDGKLLVIAQEDYGHRIAVDLINGIIAIDYEHLGFQNGSIELGGDKVRLWICEETNIAGEMFHLEQKEELEKDEFGRMRLEDGRFVKTRTDYLTPLVWRPIWFSRVTNGIPTKVIGAQTTLPKEMGGRNVKKMISIFIDGRMGID